MSSSGGPARYEIRIEGALGSRWAAWFDGLQVESEGTQTVRNPVAGCPVLPCRGDAPLPASRADGTYGYPPRESAPMSR